MSDKPQDPAPHRGTDPAPDHAPAQHAADALKHERRRSGASLLAFGGTAVLIALVAVAYFLFVKPKHEAAPAGEVASNASTSSTAPVAKRPAPPAGPSAKPNDAPPPAAPPANALTSPTDATIEMAKPSFAEGEPIVLTVSGLPGNDQDYVAVAATGAPVREYETYQYGGSQKQTRLTFRPIEKAGHYEARAFFADSFENIRGHASFDVVPAAPVTVVPNKPVYSEGEPIQVTVTGLPGNDRDLVAIAEAGTPQDRYVAYEYAHGAKTATIKLRPVMTAGRYELRVFFDDTVEAGLMRASVPFEVKPLPSAVLTLDRPSFALGEAITGRFADMPGNHDDWVSTAKAQQPDAEYLRYAYTEGTRDGAFSIPSPMTEGDYEVRAYFADSTGDKTVRARLPFHVTAAMTPVLSLGQPTVKPGEIFTISFKAMPGNQKDWIGISPAGAPDADFQSYRYTGGARDGNTDLTAPDAPGNYEVRAYFDDVTSDRVVRARLAFTVSDAPSAPDKPNP